MKSILAFTLIIIIVIIPFAFAQEEDNSDLTELGQKVPEFNVKTLEGQSFNSHELDGKVTFINFFATWCGPCNREMPHLEKDIWRNFKDEAFTVISIGREHNNDEVKKFKAEKGLSFPMAADPGRDIYKQFATKFIPRNYILDKDGTIMYQSKGFTEEEQEKMITAIQTLLKK